MQLPNLIFERPELPEKVAITNIDMVTLAVELVAQYPNVVIKDQDTCEQANTYLRRVSSTAGALNEARLEVTEPYRSSASDINDRVKQITKPLDEIIGALKARLGKYAMDQEAKRAAQAAEIQKLEQEAQLQKDGRLTAPLVLSQGLPIEAAPVSTRRDVKVTIQDETKIPRKYWIRDDVLIKADSLAGVVIPGVLAEEIRKVVAR